MDQVSYSGTQPQLSTEKGKGNILQKLFPLLLFVFGLSAITLGIVISKLLIPMPQNSQPNFNPRIEKTLQGQVLLYFKSDGTKVSLISVSPSGEKRVISNDFPKDDFSNLKSIAEDLPLIYFTSKTLFYIRDPQSRLFTDLLSKVQQLPSDEELKKIFSNESQKKKELIKVDLTTGGLESFGEIENSTSESLVPGPDFTLISQHVVLGEKPGMKRISSRTYLKPNNKSSEKTLLVDDLTASSSGYLKFVKICSDPNEFLAIREESTRTEVIENPEIYKKTGQKDVLPVLPHHGFSGHYYSSTGMDRLFSPDCKKVAIVKREKDHETVVIRNLADGKETTVFENRVFNPVGIVNLSFSSDGEHLLVDRGAGYDLISLKSSFSKKSLTSDRVKQEKLLQNLTINTASHWFYRLSNDGNYLVFHWPIAEGEKLILYDFSTDKFVVLDEVNIKYSPNETSTFSDAYKNGFTILGWSTLGNK